MCFTDTLGLGLSILGIYELLLYLRYLLLPCYFIPLLSGLFDETRQLLDCAEAIGAIPPQSEHRSHLDLSTNQFTRMRMESNHAPMIFQQLRLTIQRGLAYRLYSLYSQIKAIKSKLELAVDERQLAIMEGTSNTAVPGLAIATATFVNVV